MSHESYYTCKIVDATHPFGYDVQLAYHVPEDPFRRIVASGRSLGEDSGEYPFPLSLYFRMDAKISGLFYYTRMNLVAITSKKPVDEAETAEDFTVEKQMKKKKRKKRKKKARNNQPPELPYSLPDLTALEPPPLPRFLPVTEEKLKAARFVLDRLVFLRFHKYFVNFVISIFALRFLFFFSQDYCYILKDADFFNTIEPKKQRYGLPESIDTFRRSFSVFYQNLEQNNYIVSWPIVDYLGKRAYDLMDLLQFENALRRTESKFLRYIHESFVKYLTMFAISMTCYKNIPKRVRYKMHLKCDNHWLGIKVVPNNFVPRAPRFVVPSLIERLKISQFHEIVPILPKEDTYTTEFIGTLQRHQHYFILLLYNDKQIASLIRMWMKGIITSEIVFKGLQYFCGF